MPGDRVKPSEPSGAPTHRDSWRPSLKYWLGILVQLTVPIGAFAAAVIATRFEARSSTRAILNQREQADSQLIMGSERAVGKSGVDKIRWELRSVAHRIADRQISTLWEDKTIRPCVDAGAWEATIYLFSGSYADDAFNAFSSIKRPGIGKQTFYYRMNASQQPLRVISPDCVDVLTIAFERPDWVAETVQVQATRNAAGSNYPTNPFTFPFSDNTLFSDGNRFALFMKDLTTDVQDGKERHLVTLRVRWFPKSFYPPTERPANQSDVRRQLKMGVPES